MSIYQPGSLMLFPTDHSPHLERAPLQPLSVPLEQLYMSLSVPVRSFGSVFRRDSANKWLYRVRFAVRLAFVCLPRSGFYRVSATIFGLYRISPQSLESNVSGFSQRRRRPIANRLQLSLPHLGLQERYPHCNAYPRRLQPFGHSIRLKLAGVARSAQEQWARPVEPD